MTRAHNDNMMTKSNKQWWQELTRWLWEDRAWHPPLFTLIQHFQFIFFVISIWGKRRLWAFAYAYTIYIAYQRVAIKHFQSIEMRYSPKTPEEDSVQQHLKPNSLGQASCIIVACVFQGERSPSSLLFVRLEGPVHIFFWHTLCIEEDHIRTTSPSYLLFGLFASVLKPILVLK